MGLDVSYFTNTQMLPDAEVDEDGEGVLEKTITARVNPDFKEQADSIQDRAVYSFEETDGFRAGSYSGYNQWRDELARLAGYASARDVWNREQGHDGPFFPLINFSDCEGVIGPETSARLAKDFADHQAKADASDDSWFRQKYADWRTAFEAVAGNGFVDFA